ncbi:MAG: hypothetical protein Q6M04_06360 [Thermostichus sp. BF3_bins_97]
MSPSPLPPDATRPLSMAQQAQPMPHPTLQEALGHLHLDVLQELERFRLWQRLQRTTTYPSPNPMPSQIPSDPNGLQRSGQPQNGSSVQRSAPVLIQEVVEDLEVEETQRPAGVFSPLLVLLLWALSCAGIGFGVRWLIWPEELSLPQTSTLPTPTEEGIPTQVNLAQLPLIPLGPVEAQVGEEFYSGRLDPSQLALGLVTTPDLGDLQIDPLEGTPNLLDSLQTDLTLVSATTPLPPPRLRTVEQLAASLERPSQPTESLLAPPLPASNSNLDSLGPNRGEGTFLVLTTYLGDESLARARQVADGAFVKDVDGQKFVQLAAFEQLEYARYHAETLKNQGFNVTITEQ